MQAWYGDDDMVWLTYAGTAFSAMGAILNGTNSLYGLGERVAPHPSHYGDAQATAGGLAFGLIGGTAALTSGVLAAVKAGGAGLSLGAVSLSAGCMYASVSFLYILYNLTRVCTDRPPKHAPQAGSEVAAQFPTPDWLSTRVLNWGVVGHVGVGKSTLINTLRGITAKHPDAAAVGVGHTTRRPTPYCFSGDVARITRNMARFWDLPGAGAREWPTSTYIRDAGLRHFDGVLFVIAGPFTETEASLVSQLVEYNVPYYVVRNKCDHEVVNNAEDNNADVVTTLGEIRAELQEYGCDPDRTFLISAKHPECGNFDYAKLLRRMASDVASQRTELPDFSNDAVQSPFKKLFALTDRRLTGTCDRSRNCTCEVCGVRVGPLSPSSKQAASPHLDGVSVDAALGKVAFHDEPASPINGLPRPCFGGG